MWQTPVAIPTSDLQLRHGDRLIALGSCFVEDVSQYLRLRHIDILSNPLGIAYNPASIALHAEYLTKRRMLDSSQWLHVDGTWRHPDFHSILAHADQQQASARISSSLLTARAHLRPSRAAILTLGTSMAWIDKDGQIVTNCHKQPAGTYTRDMLDIQQLVHALSSTIHGLREITPKLAILLTISPVRHWRDGAVNNTRSKARLVEAVHTCLDQEADVHYFPSYELLLDELRDYRFYGHDMLHPSERTVNYVAQRFLETHYTSIRPEAWNLLERLIKLSQHRPQDDVSWLQIRKQKEAQIIRELASEHDIHV